MNTKRYATALVVSIALIGFLASGSSRGAGPEPTRVFLPVVANQRVLPSTTPTATRTPTRTATPTRTLTRTATPTVTPTASGDCSTVPTLLSPANGAHLDTLIPLYQWDSGSNPNATKFRLEGCRNADCSRLFVGFTSGGRLQGVWDYRCTANLDPATTYYWRARLQCGDVIGAWSPIWSFTTGSGGVILPAPQLIAPPDNTTLPGTSVTLEWSAASGTAEYLVQYLEGETTYSYVVTPTQLVNPHLHPNVTYPWWVQARNDYAWGAEPTHWHFTTGAAADENAAIIPRGSWFLQRGMETVEK